MRHLYLDIFSGRTLLQTCPGHLVSQIDKALRSASTFEGVLEIQKEHFWSLGFHEVVGSVHVRVRRDANEQLVLAHVTNKLLPLVQKLTIQVNISPLVYVFFSIAVVGMLAL